MMKPNSLPLNSEMDALTEVELATGYRMSRVLYATLSPSEIASLKQGIDDMINGRTVPHRQVMDELYHEFAPSYLVKSLEK